MVKLWSKTLALVISAMKNMRESKGSSSRDILNYISSIYEIPQDVAKRQMVAALKRGIAHGIVKKSEGYYSLPTDTEPECVEIAAQELGLLDLCCRRKKRERRRKKGCKKGSSSRRKRRKSRGKGCKKRVRSRRKKRGKGCGCEGKSRRGRSARKRGKRGKSRCAPKIRPKNCNDVKALEANVIRQSDYLNIENDENDKGKFADRPNSRSRMKSRSRSRNRKVTPTA